MCCKLYSMSYYPMLLLSMSLPDIIWEILDESSNSNGFILGNIVHHTTILVDGCTSYTMNLFFSSILHKRYDSWSLWWLQVRDVKVNYIWEAILYVPADEHTSHCIIDYVQTLVFTMNLFCKVCISRRLAEDWLRRFIACPLKHRLPRQS